MAGTRGVDGGVEDRQAGIDGEKKTAREMGKMTGEEQQ